MRYIVCMVYLPDHYTGDVKSVNQFDTEEEAIEHRNFLNSECDDPDIFYIVEVRDD